tara:strand:+ start:481 stop:1122 length:642 start_codon:yes stop_codon:yes gene_type:complete
MAIAGMIFKAGKWIAQQSIKKRMATRAKMQKKSKPAIQKAKAQQAVKKHQAKKTEAWGMRKMPGGAYGVPGTKKVSRPPRVRAKQMLKRSKAKVKKEKLTKTVNWLEKGGTKPYKEFSRPKIYAAPGMREGTGVFTRYKKVSDALSARAKFRKAKPAMSKKMAGFLGATTVGGIGASVAVHKASKKKKKTTKRRYRHGALGRPRTGAQYRKRR